MSRLFDSFVASYSIDKNSNPEFFEIIDDIYSTPEVKSLSSFVQHSDINRLDHITSVTYLSYLFSKKLGLDYVSTARGAVMHDLFYYDWHDGDWSHRPHGYRHPGFALKNARELDPAITEKEENIILRHMWPLTVIPPKYPEGMIVSLCDKYCAAMELLIADKPYFRQKFNSRLTQLNLLKELGKDD